MSKTPSPRDVVVVRVSSQGDRDGEHFHSPEVQAEAAERWAKTRAERIVAEPFRRQRQAAAGQAPRPDCRDRDGRGE